MTENPLGYEKISKLLKNFAVPSIVASLIANKNKNGVKNGIDNSSHNHADH